MIDTENCKLAHSRNLRSPSKPLSAELTAATAATALVFRFLNSVCAGQGISGLRHRQFQLIGRRPPLVVLHRSFAGRERHRYITNAINAFQRVRDASRAAATRHSCDIQNFRLHCVASFQLVKLKLRWRQLDRNVLARSSFD